MSRLGQKGEEIACEYFRKKGYNIIKRNFQSHFGEIDLIAEKNKTIVFIEVKLRTNLSKGMPEESITEIKKNRIFKTAEYFLMKNPDYFDYRIRFDFLGILLYKGKTNIIHHNMEY